MPNDSSLVGNIEDNTRKAISPVDCVEYSTLSQKHWYESRNKGCLSKTVNGKNKYYSRLRELTRPNDEILKYIQQASPNKIKTSDEKIKKLNKKRSPFRSPQERRNSFGTVIFSPSLKSVAILEDLSHPPHMPPEDQVMLFTMDEFLSFLQSPDWCGDGHNKVLRVLHGPILQRLQMALHALEARGQIIINTNRTILNNGYFYSSASNSSLSSQSDSEYSSNGKRKSLVSRSSGRPEWMSEKVLVDVFYYGKENISTTNLASEVTNLKNLVKLSINQPISNKMYPTERLKLPAEEFYDPHAKIESLESELEKLIIRKEREKELQQQKDDTGKKTDHKKKGPDEMFEKLGPKARSNDSGVIDDIADDPYLIPEVKEGEVEKETKDEEKVIKLEPVQVERVESVESKIVGEKTENDSDEAKRSLTDTSALIEAQDETVDSQAVVKETNETEDKRPSKKSVMDVRKQSIAINKSVTVETFKGETENDENDVKAIESDIEIKEEFYNSEASSSDENLESSMIFEKKHRLYLSGKELYVSAIYSEKNKNAESATVRLQKTNEALLKSRLASTKKMYHDLYKNRIDIGTRFKSLSKAREIERRKNAAPKVPKIKLDQVQSHTPGLKFKATQWDNYAYLQEQMEMKVATHSPFYEDFMKRLKKTIGDDSKIQRKDNKKERQKPNKNTNAFVNATKKLPRIKADTNESPGNRYGHNQTDTIRNLRASERKKIFKDRLDLNNSQGDDHPMFTVNDNKYHNTCNSNTAKDEETEKNRYTNDSNNPLCSTVTEHNGQKSQTYSKSKHNPSKSSKIVVDDRHKSVSFQINSEKKERGKNYRYYKSGPFQLSRKKYSNRQEFSTKSATTIVKGETRNHLINYIIEQRKRIVRPSGILFVRNQTTGKYMRRSIVNHNRNSSLMLETASEKLEVDGSDLKESSFVESDEPQENIEVKRESSESLELGPTESKLIEQALNEYSIKCKCLECIDDEEDLFKELLPKIRQHPFTYPINLGHLKRDYKYLSPNTQKSNKLLSEGNNNFPDVQHEISDGYLRDTLLTLLDKMVIRKDIVISSLGERLTTFVFIKPGSCTSKTEG